MKTGSQDWAEVRVPTLADPPLDYTDLQNRVRYTRGKVRAHVERDIANRRKRHQHTAEDDLE